MNTLTRRLVLAPLSVVALSASALMMAAPAHADDVVVAPVVAGSVTDAPAESAEVFTGTDESVKAPVKLSEAKAKAPAANTSKAAVTPQAAEVSDVSCRDNRFGQQWANVQLFFEQNGGTAKNNKFGLDQNKDGIVCDSVLDDAPETYDFGSLSRGANDNTAVDGNGSTGELPNTGGTSLAGGTGGLALAAIGSGLLVRARRRSSATQG